MTSCAANWPTQTFCRLFDDLKRRSHGRRLSSAPLCLEALESRNLLANPSGVWSFVSAPALHPMKVNVLNLQPGASRNPILIAPYDESTNPSELVGETGPMIVDSSGNLIWFRPLSADNAKQAIDFQTQTLFGKPVLTWWQGTISGIAPSKLPPGFSLPGGHFVIYNDHYREIATVQAPAGFSTDEHELSITPQGDAYFIATKVVKANLTPYGGPRDGSFEDPYVMEENIRTGKLIFSWNMAAHVPIVDSMVAAPTTSATTWDAYHANSMEISSNGSQLLISARNTWGIYDVSRKTGQILWQIGGKQNQFSLPSSLITGPYGSAFQYQHDARFTPGGISLFDDSGIGSPPDAGPYGPGRGLIMNLNLQSHTASLADPPYYHDPALYPANQGDLQILANGDVLIGWGGEAQSNGQLISYYTEYSPSGTVLADYSLAGQDITYRAVSMPWVGLPLTNPAAAAIDTNGQTTVYASWNGSTQTVAWQLLAGPSRKSLSSVSVTARTGFETAIPASTGLFYEVRAVDASGKVLSSSAIFRAHS